MYVCILRICLLSTELKCSRSIFFHWIVYIKLTFICCSICLHLLLVGGIQLADHGGFLTLIGLPLRWGESGHHHLLEMLPDLKNLSLITHENVYYCVYSICGLLELAVLVWR